MRLRDIPPIVRAAVSLLCIAAGVALLYFTWLDGDGSEEPGSSSAAPSPTATVTAVPSRCAAGWTEVDHQALRFRVCIPSNMVFSTGTSTMALREIDQADPRFINDFHVVNLAWLNPWPEVIPADPLLPPLRIAFRLPPADYGIEGCSVPATPPGASGVQACSDRLFVPGGVAFIDPNGDFHRYRALIPSASAPGGKLFMQADSMTAAWAAQEAIVLQVLESVQPY